MPKILYYRPATTPLLPPAAPAAGFTVQYADLRAPAPAAFVAGFNGFPPPVIPAPVGFVSQAADLRARLNPGLVDVFNGIQPGIFSAGFTVQYADLDAPRPGVLSFASAFNSAAGGFPPPIPVAPVGKIWFDAIQSNFSGFEAIQ